MRSEEPQHGTGGMFCIDTTARNKTKCSVVYSANQKDMLSNENSFLPNYAYYMQAEIGHLKKKKHRNTLCLPFKIVLLKYCFQFPFSLTMVSRENESNAYAKLWRGNKKYYGIFESGLCTDSHMVIAKSVKS